MNITNNNTMIFAREIDGKIHYRAGLSKKNKNGEYENGYIDVRLPKDDKLENQTRINIKKAFLTFYKTKKDDTIFYIVIQEYEKVAEEKIAEKDPYEEFGKRVELEQQQELPMDLPF